MRTFFLVFIELAILAGILVLEYYYSPLMEDHPTVPLLLNFLAFILVVDVITRLVKSFYSRRHQLPRGAKDNFHFGVENISKLLIGIGLVVTAFGFFGIDFRSLVTSLSIVAAAIAIISKEYINDFLVGLYFSFTRNLKINDYVKIGEHKGKILEIEMLKMRLLDENDDVVILPHSKIYGGEIINYTQRDIRSMSIDFQVDINSIESLDNFEQALIQALDEYAEYIKPGSFNLKVVDMKKDALDVKFQYTLHQLDRDLQRQIRRSTVRKIFDHLARRRTPKSGATSGEGQESAT
ncbi:mechanosensitive ion channel family protein [Lewinella sp. W8]|uniref:mechanosensitive ion channel family protein n=1 Tax=Lewinella sp. W8 TaxID=2528208 RepID=UPI001068BE30|nr:mechanosensitive ion channel domain-containing protein [Lewinella sp. W8]MTB50795.1 mechanosensitive ion channel [Lewinella sp. W8]